MERVSVDDQETIGLLKSLIAINSVNPTLMAGGPGEGEIAQRIFAYLQSAGLDTRLDEIAPGRFNVVGIIRSANPEPGHTLMLNGHMDTVSIGKMTIDPFDPSERDGKIYGRGSADMKAGVTAMLVAAAAVARSGVGLRGDLIVAAVADEEYASIGTEALVKTCRADAAIVTEPTGLDIVVAHKGFAWAKYTVEGRAAHGSKPEEGVDAIMLMGELLQEINRYDRETLHQRNHPMLGRPSIHASLIHGGTELSTYPDFCELQVERRTLPGESRARVIGELNDLWRRCEEKNSLLKGRSEVFLYRDALEVDREATIVQTLRTEATQHLGRTPAYSSMSGWMDTGILSAVSIPSVVFGPGGEGFHAAVEYTYRDQVVQCAQILAQTIVSFCGK